jgi:hypothetical protein
MNFLFHHEFYHYLVTIIIILILYGIFKNYWVILFAVVTGILVDIDHLFDYLYYSVHHSSLRFPFAVDYFKGSMKVFVLFHGWEYIPLLFFLGKYLEILLNTNGIMLALILGYTGHLTIDVITYRPSPLGYFLLYRLINGFNIVKFNKQ